MRDPYSVLGVPRSATEAEIKKAWRKLAKQHHPDHNRNDPKSAAKLAEVNGAYDILGDKEKRGKFDRGEIDAEGKPRFAGFEGFEGFRQGGRGGSGAFEFEFGRGGFQPRPGGKAGPDPGDLFSDLFETLGGRGRGGPQPRHFAKGDDVAATVRVPLAEAVKGTRARVRLPTGKDLEVTIPAGAENGRTMRLRGQGFSPPGGGEAGDALLTVEVEPHPLFRVEGRDLRLELPVTIDEAVLGATVRVPTLDGPVDLAVPPGSNSGRRLRLKGKGLPSPAGSGHLYVTLKVVLPEGDSSLAELAETIRAERPYAVRGPDFEG
jgi:DnaJ-class molecular chaperone